MSLSPPERLRRTVEGAFAPVRDLVPRYLLMDVAELVDDAMATHPFVTRLVAAALDPDAPVRVMQAQLSGSPPAASSPSVELVEPAVLAERLRGLTGLTPEQRALIAAAPELVEPIARRFRGHDSERARAVDLVRCGEDALIEAARRFVPEHEEPFECVAWTFIHAAMRERMEEPSSGEASPGSWLRDRAPHQARGRRGVGWRWPTPRS